MARRAAHHASGLIQCRAQAIVESGPPSTGVEMHPAERKWYEFYKPKWVEVQLPPLEDEVQTFAEYALAAFIVMRDFALAHKVPIIRDE